MTDIDPIELGDYGRWNELAKLGKEAWNLWANNEATKPPEQRQVIMLGGQRIESVSWQGFLFPSVTRFDGSVFSEEVSFAQAKFLKAVYFTNCQFSGRSHFYLSEFFDLVFFDHAIFHNNSNFSGCEFHGISSFSNTQFLGFSIFDKSKFKDVANFTWSEFSGALSGRNLTVEGILSFGGALFSKGVFLKGSHFVGPTEFSGTSFASQLICDNAEFCFPPDFRSTSFVGPPPSLLGSRILYKTERYKFLFRRSEDPEAYDKYRQLKKLSAESHDHETELSMAALEAKSKRFWLHKPFGEGTSSFWLGYLYQATSDFGRSISRPIGWIVVLLLFSTLLFSTIAMLRSVLALQLPSASDLYGALIAAIANLFPFAGQAVLGREIMVESLCGPLSTPYSDFDLHCLAMVYGVSFVEGLFGAVFLFLLALGLRNRFRIK